MKIATGLGLYRMPRGLFGRDVRRRGIAMHKGSFQIWGGGPFNNTRSCIALCALIVKLTRDLEDEIKLLEKKTVAEQEAVALVRCITTLMKFDSHKGLGPPQWNAEKLRDRFFAWLASANNANPRKWRAATSEAAEQEFKALIARCPVYLDGVE